MCLNSAPMTSFSDRLVNKLCTECSQWHDTIWDGYSHIVWQGNTQSTTCSYMFHIHLGPGKLHCAIPGQNVTYMYMCACTLEQGICCMCI